MGLIRFAICLGQLYKSEVLTPPKSPNVYSNKSLLSIPFTFMKNAYHLPFTISPRHYNIDLKLDFEKDIFYGTSNINIFIYNATSIIYFNSKGLNITNSTLIENNDKMTEHIIRTLLYIEEMEIVVLHFDHKLSSGYYILNMKFMGIIDNDGFSKTSYINDHGDTQWFVATRTATGARRVFPCWDEPRFKARFNITIKHHERYRTFSNMPIVHRVVITDNFRMTSFETTPEIPSYHVAVVLYTTSFISFKDINLWDRQQLAQDLKFAHSVIENITHYFQDKFKQLTNFPIARYVTIPGLLDDGIAKRGLILYRDDDIIYNEELDSIMRQVEVARLIGHKIFRERLSSMKDLSKWSHQWLNEAIATLLYIDINKDYPHISDLFIIRTVQESLYLESIMNPVIPKVENISDINSFVSFSYRIKAPTIIRMLQHVLGNDVYQTGMNIYLKYPYASLENFWAAMQTAYNNATIKIKDLIIRDMIDPWIKRKHYPILNVERYEVGKDITAISVKYDSTTWWIPVTFTTQTFLDFNNTLPRNWIKPQSSMSRDQFFISVHEWIILNVQQTGYYRVNYTTINWIRLGFYLNSVQYTNIHVLNRAQIIDDAFHFMTARQLNSSIFWKLTKYLSRDTDYVAWYPMLKAIERMSYIFPFPESKDFKKMVLDHFRLLLQLIGYKVDKSNDNFLTECLRQEASKWACVLGDNECKREALDVLQLNLFNPIKYKLSPWWRKWAYCHGLKSADISAFLEVIDIYSKKFKEIAKELEFLACSDNYSLIPDIINKIKSISYNKSSISGKSEQNNKDYIRFFHYIVERHAKSNSLLDYILSNWEEVKPKEISTTVALVDIINHVYSSEQLDKIMEFVNNSEELLTFCYKYNIFGTSDFLLNKMKVRIYESKSILFTKNIPKQ